MSKVKLNTIYKHVRSGGLYRTLHIAHRVKTKEPTVVYKSINGKNKGIVWVRSYESFIATEFGSGGIPFSKFEEFEEYSNKKK